MKRHSDQEISAILQRARELEQAGRLQADICEMFGISVMTLHRWRKMERTSVNAAAAKRSAAAKVDIEENRLLRKIAFDLLLEIAALKEGLEGKRAA
jgi:transcriptional regulator with XRE-family HTH domain